MSNIVPNTQLGKIQWCEDHNAPFTLNAGSIGLTSTQVTTLHGKTVIARSAYNAQQAAQDAAKAATLTLKTSINDMSAYASDCLSYIKAKAQTDGPSVYALAQIPAPATPTPIGNPGTPTDFRAELNPDGSLNLSWKCVNPAGATGTTYQVFRKLTGESDFTFAGASGTKSFLDNTVPSTGSPITYSIVGIRSTASGTAAQFVVNFGTSGGAMMASVSAPRIAA